MLVQEGDERSACQFGAIMEAMRPIVQPHRRVLPAFFPLSMREIVFVPYSVRVVLKKLFHDCVVAMACMRDEPRGSFALIV